jgi:cell division protein FtsB
MKNALILFAVAIMILIAFLPSYSVYQDKKQKVEAIEADIEQLEVKKAKLLTEKELLENDPVYLEKVAREKMGLIKEGEEVVEIIPKH